jgi:A/G-specific adenine glycosylase
MPVASFGRTDVKQATLTEQIGLESAERLLRAHNVKNPRERLEQFVVDLPVLLAWLEANGRLYPWRETTDPWRVYITEILLQRTRGDAVASVYDDFFAKYPDPESLHSAPRAEIKDTVQSLGFGNQRTRSLQESAALIVNEHNGSVPPSLEALKSPWRVGDYSARATLLFAFQQPQPLVDANIARIVGRYFDYPMPDQPHKQVDVYDLMRALTPTDPGVARGMYFAFLDLGAMICTPEAPKCNFCPLSDGCQYFISTAACE